MAQLYDRIGSGYDVTRRPDPIIAGRLGHHLALETDGNYLDIACGTGNYTFILAAVGGSWTGIELSAKMIAEARGKSCDGAMVPRPRPRAALFRRGFFRRHVHLGHPSLR